MAEATLTRYPILFIYAHRARRVTSCPSTAETCERCLGPQHADLALEPQPTCRSCALLPLEERRWRVAFFKARIGPQGESTESGSRSQEEASCAQQASSAERETNDPASKEDTGGNGEGEDDSDDSVSGSDSASVMESAILEEKQLSDCSVNPGLPMSTTTPLPAVGALLLELPSLIQEAASAKGLPVPQPPPSHLNELAGRFGSASSRCPDPIWPQFPAVMDFLAEAAAEPAKLRAPVSTYAPITRVEGFTERSFPSVPPLDPGLAEVFAYGISKQLEETALPEDLKSSLCKEADAILNLCATTVICSSGIAAWATQIHLAPSMTEKLRKDLLDGPITADGLFGANVYSLVKKSQQTQEVSESFRHLVRPQPEPRTSGRWRDRCGCRQQERCSTAAAASSRPAPPPSSSVPTSTLS
ncbi:uncharacterized protein LOC106519354 [Austrofundulus limnaeus]|uniref:Uncharacterized protein LOC106519354 n=1 Tax=Austrofundulus limnaeus TaxID=52670 RepID=A0A2I4BFC8_AUSLI|nr:PREDICTED: uncharacterized protein LOC106519354 [Austrofundulus limnaeus]